MELQNIVSQFAPNICCCSRSYFGQLLIYMCCRLLALWVLCSIFMTFPRNLSSHRSLVKIEWILRPLFSWLYQYIHSSKTSYIIQHFRPCFTFACSSHNCEEKPIIIMIILISLCPKETNYCVLT